MKKINRILTALVLLSVINLLGISAAGAGEGDKPATQKQEEDRMLVILKEKLPDPLQPLPAPPSDMRNFEGTWIANQLTQLRTRVDMNGDPVPVNKAAQAILQRRVKATYEEGYPYANAATLCRPPGQPWQIGMLYPFQILQTSGAVTFLFSEYHTIWNIYLKDAPRDQTAYMGISEGKWAGDTLEVTTTGYKQALWLDPDGTPVSKDATLSFRIRRLPDAQLEIITTIDDPVFYDAPWSLRTTFDWRPDMQVFAEYDCEPVVSAPDYLESYTLKPEDK